MLTSIFLTIFIRKQRFVSKQLCQTQPHIHSKARVLSQHGGQIGHFTVKDGSEAEGDLVLIQTFFALLWKLFLKNAS